MRKERVQELLRSYADKTISDIERKELYHFLKDAANEALFVDALLRINTSAEKIDFDESYLSILDKVYQLDRPEMPADNSIIKPISPAHRIHFLRRSWFRNVAAILIIIGSVAFFWATSRKTEQTPANEVKRVQEDIDPGGNKAVLTLADGTTITLDSVANGALAQQGSSAIIKLANGQIIYKTKGFADGEVMMNKMSTPRGGQYQLVLPDKSKVWLNAASSITYPVVFAGTKRSVKVTGEVYFEVAKNKEKPFIVDVDGRATVQVLGTSFNVNSYSDEESIKTSVLEGSVLVGANNHNVILKPGQQAIHPTNTASVSGSSGQQPKVVNVDISQVLAWKNGFFNLQDASLKQVTQQFERWYDIQVKYEGSVPDVQFKGRMNRGVKLSTVINWFSDLGIKTRLEGKTLIIF